MYNELSDRILRRITHALKSYEKALMIFKKAYGDDHPHVAMRLNNMGAVVYQKECKYSKALECHQQVLVFREKYLPTDHQHFGFNAQQHW